jgi:hypothetical protein
MLLQRVADYILTLDAARRVLRRASIVIDGGDDRRHRQHGEAIDAEYRQRCRDRCMRPASSIRASPRWST